MKSIWRCPASKKPILGLLDPQKEKEQGEVPLYHVKANHEPIISKDEFEQVQKLMAERAAEYGTCRSTGRNMPGNMLLVEGIICGSCGAVFKRRTWNTKLRSKQIVWQCSTYIKEGKAQCSMKALDDITLKKRILKGFQPALQKQGSYSEALYGECAKGAA